MKGRKEGGREGGREDRRKEGRKGQGGTVITKTKGGTGEEAAMGSTARLSQEEGCFLGRTVTSGGDKERLWEQPI